MATVETVTVKEVAARLRVRQEAVLHWIKSGQLAAMNVTLEPKARRKEWRIRADALEAFEKSRQAPTTKTANCKRASKGDVVEYY
jgi:excisionase family DNA binding protein